MQELFSYQNFVALSKEVQELVKRQAWFSAHGVEWIKLAARFGLWGLGFAIFSGPGWVFKSIGMVVLSYAFYGLAISATHESAHLAFAKSKRVNLVMAHIFSDFWSGLANQYWFRGHVTVHHVVTNIIGEEPQNWYFPWLNKYVYFFVAPYLVFFWTIAQTVRFLWGKWGKLILSITLWAAGIFFHTYIFTWFVSSWLVALFCTYLMRSLFAPVFMQISIFNHLGMENPKTKLPWLPHQTKTTRNLKRSWFLVGMGGNAFIHCHIEHHLFPALSNNLLAKIRPIIMKYLRQEGYQYVEETYWSCLAHCLKYYRQLFKAWKIEL